MTDDRRTSLTDAAEQLRQALSWPETLTPFQAGIASLEQRHEYYREATWHLGKPWNTWTSIIKDFLNQLPRECPNLEQVTYPLLFVGDAL